MDLRNAVAVFVGGGFGSVLRYALTFAIAQRLGPGFPWWTFAINLSGSLVIGIVSELYVTRAFGVNDAVRMFLAVGVLGGYTTFSSFSLETLNLVREGAPSLAIAYALGSVVLGAAAALLGVALARAF